MRIGLERYIMRLLGAMLMVWVCFGAIHTGLASEDTLDLVRIDVGPAEDLSELAAVGITVYTRLYTEDGGMVLIVGVDANQQERLKRLGFEAVLLERDVSRSGFYLLYGLPEDLYQAGMQVTMLAVEGRQAVAALSQAQMRLLESLGVAYKPLNPQPFIFSEEPRSSAQALPESTLPDPLVQEMIDQVSASDLSSYVGDISGEWPVNIEGLPFTLSTRYSFTEPSITKAARYAYERFIEMGLPVAYHTYSLWGNQKQNLHAWQPGAWQPEREFLIIAHLDSTSQTPYTLAPGADDNASGSAGVLAVADILRQYAMGCTIRYVLFTGEEQGLVGSAAFAQYLVNQPGIQVEGVLNLDMIAYDSDSAPTLELHARTGNAADLQIANLFQQVVTAYGLDLSPEIIQPGSTFSDHSSFWNFSIPAILAIEDWSDHTPYYHQTADQLESLNIPYFTEFTRAAVGTLAHMGCLLDEGVLNGTVKDTTTSAPLAGVNVKAVLDANQIWTTTTQADGSFQLLVTPGDYEVDFHLPNYYMVEASGISVQRAKETSLKVGLPPCGEGVSFTSSPILPSVGETVTFTAETPGLPASEYEWDFGDGSTGSGQITSHPFASPGLYTVSLEIPSLCPLTVAQHSIPVELPALFFPFVPVSQN
ncbi:MAG: hypothetical protein A2Z16_01600 [Chloroflexi bacterium RBG_16_54_18]|nr:MAG: hypothetical protein A2Z16_01600 [Chloroflexi bacterium RBG_16_54_18]